MKKNLMKNSYFIVFLLLILSNPLFSKVSSSTETNKKTTIPIIIFKSPTSNPYISEDGYVTVKAFISGNGKYGTVVVKRNGTVMKNAEYFYNPKKQILTFRTKLETELVNFDVIATNKLGESTKRLVCSRNKNIKDLDKVPSIDIIEPNVSVFTTVDCQLTVTASLKNIQSKDQISIFVNDTIVDPNFYAFSTESQLVKFDCSIVDKKNVKIKVKNESGESADSIKLICSQQLPKVLLTSPMNKQNTNCQVKAKFVLKNINLTDNVEIFENGENAKVTDYVYSPANREILVNKNLPIGSYSTFEVRVFTPRGNANEFVSYECLDATKNSQATVFSAAMLNLTFISPSSSPFTATNCKYDFLLQSLGVTDKNQIKILINGVNYTAFEFDLTTKKIKFKYEITKNTSIEVIAVNGKYKANALCVVDCNSSISNENALKNTPPTLTLINPDVSTTYTCGQMLSIECIAENITSKSELSIFVNNIKLIDTQYEFINGRIAFSHLLSANSTIKIFAINKNGNVTKNFTFNCR